MTTNSSSYLSKQYEFAPLKLGSCRAINSQHKKNPFARDQSSKCIRRMIFNSQSMEECKSEPATPAKRSISNLSQSERVNAISKFVGSPEFIKYSPRKSDDPVEEMMQVPKWEFESEDENEITERIPTTACTHPIYFSNGVTIVINNYEEKASQNASCEIIKQQKEANQLEEIIESNVENTQTIEQEIKTAEEFKNKSQNDILENHNNSNQNIQNSFPSSKRKKKSQNRRNKRKLKRKGSMEDKLSEIMSQRSEQDELYDLLQKTIMLTEEMQKNFKVIRLINELKPIDQKEITERHATFKKADPSKKLLILDMDDTLIHTFDKQIHDYSKIKVDLSKVEEFSYNDSMAKAILKIKVIRRPYLEYMLSALSSLYNLVIFTAAEKEYADCILNHIDPKKKFFKGKLYRNHCLERTSKSEGFSCFVKDLRIFKDFQMEDVIILDNSIVSFFNHLDNGIYIPSYLGEQSDNHLFKITSFLQSIYEVPDVRVNLKKTFFLKELYSIYLSNQNACI